MLRSLVGSEMCIRDRIAAGPGSEAETLAPIAAGPGPEAETLSPISAGPGPEAETLSPIAAAPAPETGPLGGISGPTSEAPIAAPVEVISTPSIVAPTIAPTIAPTFSGPSSFGSFGPAVSTIGPSPISISPSVIDYSFDAISGPTDFYAVTYETVIADAAMSFADTLAADAAAAVSYTHLTLPTKRIV